MVRLLASISICVLLFLSGGAICAQETASPPAHETDPEIEVKVLAQVEQAIQEAKSLRLAENRLRLQTKAAVLLWPYRQAAARAFLKEVSDAFQAWASGLNQMAPDYSERLNNVANLRNELLQDLVKCDAKVALAFLRATGRQSDAASPAQANQDANQEMSLAAKLAEKDPKEALRIAQDGLNKGLLNGVGQILAQLRTSDTDASAELANQIITRLQGENLASNTDAANMAVLLLTMTHVKSPDSPGVTQAVDSDSSRYILVSEDARRNLVNLIASAVAGLNGAQVNASQPLLNILSQIMPEVERDAPSAQLSIIRQKKQAFDKMSDPNVRQWRKYGSLVDGGTADSLISAAAQAPPEIRDELYFEAAGKALNNGETERARQIAEQISTPQRRAAKIKDVDQQALAQTADQGRFQEAAQYARMKAAIDERVEALVYLANAAAQKKDKVTARKFLDEALGLIGRRRAENEKEFFWQLQLARAFSNFDLKISFELVEGAMGQLDEMIAAAAGINGFGFTWLEEGELKPYGGEPWMQLSRQCAEEIALLGVKDFNRALKATQRFQRTEVRLLCLLAIAQRVLSEKAKEKEAEKQPQAGSAAVERHTPARVADDAPAIEATARSF